MANVNAANGLSPVMHLNGAPWNQQVQLYRIPSGDTSQYGIGDIVKLAAGADANGVPDIAKAVNSDAGPVGVLVGIDPVLTAGTSLQGTSLTLETIAIPATKTKAYYVYVVTDPSVLYEVQADNTGTLTASTWITSNAKVVVGNPATNSPYSGTVLDSTSFAVTSSLMFTVVGLTTKPGADFTAYTRFLVKFNKHAYFGTFTAPATL